MSDSIRIARLLAINLFDLSPNFSLDTHMHEDWEFIYIDSGVMGYVSNGVPGTLNQGEILFHCPGVPHRTVCDGKHGASFFNVIFRSNSPAIACFMQRKIRVPAELIPLLRAMIAESERTYTVSVQPLKKRPDAPVGGEQILRSYTELFLLLLRRELLAEQKRKTDSISGTSSDLPSDEVQRYLADHLCDKVSLAMLSEHFHFGKTHLCVQFRKKTGVSIVSYHQNLKIAEAKRLLREEKLTVRECSEKLGFDSPEYFSRCFKKQVGLSPRAFRSMLISGSRIKRD